MVACGLTPHSEIFQLYTSEVTIVQFPNLDLLPGTQRHGQLGVFSVSSLPRHGHWDVRRRLLPPCHQRAHTRSGYAGNQTLIFDRLIHSPAHYLYTVAGLNDEFANLIAKGTTWKDRYTDWLTEWHCYHSSLVVGEDNSTSYHSYLLV